MLETALNLIIILPVLIYADFMNDCEVIFMISNFAVKLYMVNHPLIADLQCVF